MFLFFHLLGVQEYVECLDVEMFRSIFLSFLIGVGGLVVVQRKYCLTQGTYGLFIIACILIGYFPIYQARELMMSFCLLLCGNTLFMRKKTTEVFYHLCSALCVGMALYGLSQYCGWVESNHPFFHVTGIFDNPAGISMFLSILFPYLLYSVGACRKTTLRMIAIVSIAVVTTVILMSESRTGLLAMMVGSFCLYHHKMTKRNMVCLLVGTVLLFIAFYLCKPLSSQGRLFILIITARMLSKHSLLGTGCYGFETNYMLEQAEFFKQTPFSLWNMIADNVKFPFNEFLHVIVRYGLLGAIGCVFLIGILAYVAKRNFSPIKRYAMASLYASLVCACFSYPFSYIYITLLILLAVTVVSSPDYMVKQTVSACTKRILLLVLSLSLLFLSCYQFQKEIMRCKLEKRAVNGEDTECLRHKYQQAYENSYFYHHPSFLYNYAVYLYEREDYQTTLSVLNRCKSYKRDYDWQMLYAYALKELHHLPQAAEAFELASYMIPNRMLPRYELVRLYRALYDFDKAIACAGKTLKIPMKVRTTKTEYLRDEIEKMMLELKNRKEENPMDCEW